MEINSFLITFIILIVITTIIYPISGYYEMRKLKKSFAEGDKHKKVKYYYNNIFWSWIPILLILIMLPISGVKMDSIGFKWIDLQTSSISKWIVFPSIVIYFLYLLYNIYSIIIFKYDKESRVKAAKGITNDFKWIFPITRKEKRVWTQLAITAGITEEILYRGYLFYSLAIIFPNLSLIQILFIVTLIFGIGHIYLGKEAIKSTLIGFFLGIFYIVFNSIIPVIIVHIAQDLVVRDLLEEENE
jgi:membrane protease YdiL (CAAX protease family)